MKKMQKTMETFQRSELMNIITHLKNSI